MAGPDAMSKSRFCFYRPQFHNMRTIGIIVGFEI